MPLEERICQLCHQGVESKEHYVCHYSVFYEIRGWYHCLFKQVFFMGPLVVGAVLARTPETQGQHHNHTSSSTKSSHNFLYPHHSYSCYSSIKGYTSGPPTRTLQNNYNRLGNSNLLCMENPAPSLFPHLEDLCILNWPMLEIFQR